MIHIDFVEPDTTEWIEWKKDAADEVTNLLHEMENGAKPAIKDSLYKRTRKEIFQAYHGKCGYCESLIGPTMDAEGDVEHFRPKLEVTDENGDPEMVVLPDGTKMQHPGYYWLAYDWHNLLPSCRKCNNTFKKNRFPVARGTRAYRPGEEKNEIPLLVHPMLEMPEIHFKCDEDTGILSALTEAGDKSITTLGLNREGLPEARVQECIKVEALCDKAGGCLTDKKKFAGIMGVLAKCSKGETPYSFAARSTLKRGREHMKQVLVALDLDI